MCMCEDVNNIFITEGTFNNDMTEDPLVVW